MNEDQDVLIANAINGLTEKLSITLLQDFLLLPSELQLNIVLIKSAQLLLANVLCHVAETKPELDEIAKEQGMELKELTANCAMVGFADKFNLNQH